MVDNKYRITVFTPTFNRADLLHKAYAALNRQTRKDFVWLIVDDGSTDNTREVVEKWIDQTDDFRIEYIYKENGGLQSGYVEALKHVKTELCGCVDSDGYLADNSIELILETWDKGKHDGIAGVMAFDGYEDGTIIGELLPEPVPSEIDLIDLDIRNKHGKKTDRIYFIRSDIYCSAVPAKRYSGEKTMNASYILLQIALKYHFLVINKPLCLAIYNDAGLTAQGWRRYFIRPNTYADWRQFVLSIPDTPLKYKCRNIIHYIAECRIAKRRVFCKNVQKPFLTAILFPLGRLYYLYLVYKKAKDNKNI